MFRQPFQFRLLGQLPIRPMSIHPMSIPPMSSHPISIRSLTIGRMFIRLLAISTFFVSAFLLASGEMQAQNKRSVLKKLQGKWVPISLEVGGNKLPKNQIANMSLEIAELRYVVKTTRAVDRGKLQIDVDGSKEEPEMKMDIVGVEGPNKGKTFPAIFKFGDDGQLHICYNLGGKDRPAAYKSPKDSFILLAIYKKADLEK